MATVLATRIPHKSAPFSQGSDTNWNHSTKHPRQHRLKAWKTCPFSEPTTPDRNSSSWIQMFSGLAVCHVYHQLQRRPGNLLFIAMLSKTRLLESVMRGTTSSTLVFFFAAKAHGNQNKTEKTNCLRSARVAPPFCIKEISYQATQKLVGYYRILATAALSGMNSLKQPLHRRVQDFLLLIFIVGKRSIF